MTEHAALLDRHEILLHHGLENCQSRHNRQGRARFTTVASAARQLCDRNSRSLS